MGGVVILPVGTDPSFNKSTTVLKTRGFRERKKRKQHTDNKRCNDVVLQESNAFLDSCVKTDQKLFVSK